MSSMVFTFINVLEVCSLFIVLVISKILKFQMFLIYTFQKTNVVISTLLLRMLLKLMCYYRKQEGSRKYSYS
jgi:hypothetical protein